MQAKVSRLTDVFRSYEFWGNECVLLISVIVINALNR